MKLEIALKNYAKNSGIWMLSSGTRVSNWIVFRVAQKLLNVPPLKSVRILSKLTLKLRKSKLN